MFAGNSPCMQHHHELQLIDSSAAYMYFMCITIALGTVPGQLLRLQRLPGTPLAAA